MSSTGGLAREFFAPLSELLNLFFLFAYLSALFSIGFEEMGIRRDAPLIRNGFNLLGALGYNSQK